MTTDLALPPPAADGDEPPDPLYASVQDWVSEHFLPVYRRPLGGEFRWCAQWWRHAEAIIRRLCNKAIWLHQGSLVEYGEVGAVLEAYQKMRGAPVGDGATREELAALPQ